MAIYASFLVGSTLLFEKFGRSANRKPASSLWDAEIDGQSADFAASAAYRVNQHSPRGFDAFLTWLSRWV
jgi:hypothetical protein